MRNHQAFLLTYFLTTWALFHYLKLKSLSSPVNKLDATCLGLQHQLRNRSKFYPEFDEDYHDAVTSHNTNKVVIYYAKFGLGHRLTKMGSAWHLTKSLNLTRLKLNWHDCTVGDESKNTFSLLFGNKSYIDVPGITNSLSTNHANIETSLEGNDEETHRIHVVNDVDGYYGGQNFKIHKIPLPAGSYKGDNSPWLQKMDSDVQLYKILRQRFAGRKQVVQFMEEHKFQEHFVVGLHLRLGNGEKTHFVQSGRGVSNELNFLVNVMDLLRLFLERLQQSHQERFLDQCKKTKTPLIFLATDSPKFIPVITNATSNWQVKTVTMEQIRVDKGVTYELRYGQECYQGWHDMLLDSMLLSFSDVLVAPRFSTFTQSLPAHLVFDRNSGVRGPSFCECSESGQTMVCLEDMRTWIFRDDKDKMIHYSTLQEHETVLPQIMAGQEFPDVVVSDQYDKAKQFLEQESKGTQTQTLIYGNQRGFNAKYRQKPICPDCSDFVFNE